MEFQEHDYSNIRGVRRVETRLVEDDTFKYNGDPIKNSKDIFDIFESLGLKDRELAVVLFLDKSFRPIGYDIWSGGVDFVTIDPRQIFKVAAILNASAMVMVHNHPDGQLNPSQADELFCLQLSKLGQIMGWPLLDFLIIAGKNYYSFKDVSSRYLAPPSSSVVMMK